MSGCPDKLCDRAHAAGTAHWFKPSAAKPVTPAVTKPVTKPVTPRHVTIDVTACAACAERDAMIASLRAELAGIERKPMTGAERVRAYRARLRAA